MTASALYSTFATVLTGLDFLSLTPIPPILTTNFFCCFSICVNLFLHQKLKIYVKLNKQPIWQHISFLFFIMFLFFNFEQSGTLVM